jgi:hypothetical protein
MPRPDKYKHSLKSAKLQFFCFFKKANISLLHFIALTKGIKTRNKDLYTAVAIAQLISTIVCYVNSVYKNSMSKGQLNMNVNLAEAWKSSIGSVEK